MNDIARLYKNGMTIAEVSAHLCLRPGFVYNELRRLGVPRRKPGRPTGYKHTPKTIAKMTGRKRTLEARTKMRAAHVGKKLTPEHIEKIRTAGLGRECTRKTRAKLRASLKKAMNRPEVKVKCREAKLGDKNPAWRGGTSRLPYAWTFNEELKEEVRRRDRYQCQLCGVPQAEFERKLPVHHIDYDKKNSDPVNLTALCHSCNCRINGNRKHWTTWFQRKMLRRAKEERWFYGG